MNVKDYFKEKCIFITGGSGFMGKVLIEKLLRTCPEIEKIFILVRLKRDKTKVDRIKDIINVELFNELKIKYPNLLEEKIVPIIGDVLEPNLGLSKEDRAILIKEISIVFHCASSVRFIEPIKNAVLMNIRGTRDICQLALEMKKIEVFQYVSTAYSNANRKIVDETLYEPFGDWRKFIEIAENMNDEVQFVADKCLGEFPNTYVFTKSMAEHAVHDILKGKVPTIIIRPSIVMGTAKEPFKGWVDNFNGPVSVMVGGGKGLLRTVYSNPNTKLDYIPVDDAIKGMIIAVWKKGVKENDDAKYKLSVYNASGNKDFSVTMGQMVEICNRLNEKYPYDQQVWYGTMVTSRLKLTYWLRFIFQQLILMGFLDFVASMNNKKPVLVKILKQIQQAHLALRYYMFHQWVFINDKFLNLQNELLDEDKDNFKYVLGNIDLDEFFDYSAIGFKKHLLNENMLEFDRHKKRSTRMKILHHFAQICFYSFVLWIFWIIFKNHLFK